MNNSELEKSYHQARKGFIVNMEEYVKYYEVLAEQGNAGAQYNIGFCYMNGTGVERNYDKAMSYLLRAFRQGHKMAEKFIDGIC